MCPYEAGEFTRDVRALVEPEDADVPVERIAELIEGRVPVQRESDERMTG